MFKTRNTISRLTHRQPSRNLAGLAADCCRQIIDSVDLASRFVLLAFVSSIIIHTSQVAAQQQQERQEQQPKKNVGYVSSVVLPHAQTEIYKTIGDVRLTMHIFRPSQSDGAQSEQDALRPAIVFFFGGGWRSGTPKQFERQCEYLASRGMVAMTADYRVASRHHVKAVTCVADAKSAIRWVRTNARRLGIDPQRIVAAGGSAGAHIAACTGVVEGLDETGEDTSISSRPNAMVLFNPAVVLAPVNGKLPVRDPETLTQRTGIDPRAISPYHHVQADAPPTLILHGKADTIVPFETVEWFTQKMHAAGNRCELAGYDDQPHGFFNFGRAKNRNFRATVTRTDTFLTSLGYLQGDASIDSFLENLD